jgi:hypothetical protein
MIHIAFSNLKTWLLGTHHGVSAHHLQAYLNEFVFRFNRRFYPMTAFNYRIGKERRFQCGFLSFEGSIPARPCADRCATGKCQPCLIAMKRRPKHKAPPARAETP